MINKLFKLKILLILSCSAPSFVQAASSAKIRVASRAAVHAIKNSAAFIKARPLTTIAALSATTIGAYVHYRHNFYRKQVPGLIKRKTKFEDHYTTLHGKYMAELTRDVEARQAAHAQRLAQLNKELTATQAKLDSARSPKEFEQLCDERDNIKNSISFEEDEPAQITTYLVEETRRIKIRADFETRNVQGQEIGEDEVNFAKNRAQRADTMTYFHYLRQLKNRTLHLTRDEEFLAFLVFAEGAAFSGIIGGIGLFAPHFALSAFKMHEKLGLLPFRYSGNTPATQSKIINTLEDALMYGRQDRNLLFKVSGTLLACGAIFSAGVTVRAWLRERDRLATQP